MTHIWQLASLDDAVTVIRDGARHDWVNHQAGLEGAGWPATLPVCVRSNSLAGEQLTRTLASRPLDAPAFLRGLFRLVEPGNDLLHNLVYCTGLLARSRGFTSMEDQLQLLATAQHLGQDTPLQAFFQRHGQPSDGRNLKYLLVRDAPPEVTYVMGYLRGELLFEGFVHADYLRAWRGRGVLLGLQGHGRRPSAVA